MAVWKGLVFFFLSLVAGYVLGLHRLRCSSLVTESRDTLCCGVWASHCGGFFSHAVQSIGSRDTWTSVIGAHGLSRLQGSQARAGLIVVAHGLRFIQHMWDQGSRIEPVSPFSAGDSLLLSQQEALGLNFSGTVSLTD